LGVTITFWHCTKVIGMIFDLETTINHAGFAVHHNFSIIAISLRTNGAGLLKKRPDPFDLLVGEFELFGKVGESKSVKEVGATWQRLWRQCLHNCSQPKKIPNPIAGRMRIEIKARLSFFSGYYGVLIAL